jgi:glycosyltransferase involved in cell wall biosynthesis
MRTETVAVVIPARDAEATIGETLDSVAAQSRLPDEVIVVDDGSRDGTAELARSHSLAPRLLVGAGRGPAAATNLGVRAAGAAWIAALDADDLAPPGRIAASLAAAHAAGDAVAVTGLFESFHDSGLDEAARARLGYRPGSHTALLPSALFMRRDVFLDLGGYDEMLLTGFFIAFWDRVTRAGLPVAATPSLVLRRRLRPGTLSHRSAEARERIDRDFLAIARAALQRRRQAGDGG